MTDRELERRLEKALSAAAPDDLERVLARCETRKGTVIPMQEKASSGKRRKSWLTMAIAACLTLVVAGSGFGYYQINNTVASVVSLDVNPSVQLKVNKHEKVLSAQPMNEDGAKILHGMELKGTQADVAMNAIIGSLLQHGYVDELANSILITVEDEDIQRGERLQQTLTAQADAALASAQVNGAILSQTFGYNDELHKLAETYGISDGKAALIGTIVERSGQTKSFESLVGLTINELNLIYSTQLADFSPKPADEIGVIGGADGATGIITTNGISATGSASQNAYIGLEAAKDAALKHAGLSSTQAELLDWDFDYEDGRMVYELEFISNGQEHEFEVNALDGRVLKYETEGTPNGQGNGTSVSGGQGGNAVSDIGKEKAKSIALQDAGVSASDAAGMKVEKDYDDGRVEYDVEFWAGAVEYDYKIDGSTGAIVEKGIDDHGTQSAGTSTSTSDIGLEGAKSAALKHAGVNAQDAYEMKAELDYDDGRLEYEVEFKAGGMEYEYKIDGTTGSILEYDHDWDD